MQRRVRDVIQARDGALLVIVDDGGARGRHIHRAGERTESRSPRGHPQFVKASAIFSARVSVSA